MKLVHPMVSFLSADELRASMIPDEYIQDMSAHVEVAGIDPSFIVCYFTRKGPRVTMNLNECQADSNEQAVDARLKDELVGLLERSGFSGKRTDVEYRSSFVLDRHMTQRDMADLAERFAKIDLVEKISLNLTVDYHKFDGEQHFRDTLMGSGFNLRKITTLKESGGRNEAVLWRDNKVQIYEGEGARFEVGRLAVQTKDFDRYFNTDEAIQLTIDLQYGTAPAELNSLMKFGGYEWLNRAWQFKDGKLIAYSDPKGLHFKDGTERKLYKTDVFRFSEERSFDIGDLVKNGESRFLLAQFKDDFIDDLCGIPSGALPKIIQETRIDLPLDREGEIVPVAYYRPIHVLGHIGCNGSPRGMRLGSSE